ncbi:MAG TPA: mechanosensitive ion channel family protein [Paracoccaceae bacterium]|nr:mechanosensitive ion channel family protein [Paracoccaceae bacterium]
MTRATGARLAALAVWALLALGAALPASAQSPVLPGGGSGEAEAVDAEALARDPAAVEAMVARMSDEQVRDILIGRLEAAAEPAAGEAGPGPLLIAERAVAGAFLTTADAVLAIPRLFAESVRSIGAFWSERGLSGLLETFGLLAAAVAAGLAAERALMLLVRGWRERTASMARTAETSRDRVVVLGRRLLLDGAELLLFYVVARLVVVQFVRPEDRAMVAGVAIWAVLMPRIVAAVSRFILSPHQPSLRLVAADDAGAKALHRDQVNIALFVGIAVAVIIFQTSLGVSVLDTRLGFWATLIALVWVAVVAVRRADTLTSMMRGFDDDVTEVESRIARAYPRLAVIACGVVFFAFAALVGNGLGDAVANAEHLQSLVVVLLAPALDTLVRAMVREFAPPMTGEGPAAAAAHARMRRSWIRMGRVIVLGFVLAAIVRIWGLGLEALAAGEAPPAVAALARFAGVAIFGYLAWEGAGLWFDTRLARERTGAADGKEEEAGEGGGAGASRLATVLPLLSWVTRGAIVVMTVLIALSNLGVDVTPLLAGAGILGLAIGFGAQKLVTDVVSGVFFLIDDAFRTGEFVEIDGTTGMVEKISVRSMQLRHHLGPIHTIPYGEIPKITNYSRDWVIMKLKFTVPFDTDLEKVRKLFKKIGQQMMEKEEYADAFLQPFKSQGVLEVNETGIVLRGKFMAKPGKQWILRKEVYNRVQRAFEENGIQFARKEVRVRIDGGEDLTEEERAEVGAAAAEAAQEQAGAPAAAADAR